jgi:hypothetical protein
LLPVFVAGTARGNTCSAARNQQRRKPQAQCFDLAGLGSVASHLVPDKHPRILNKTHHPQLAHSAPPGVKKVKTVKKV